MPQFAKNTEEIATYIQPLARKYGFDKDEAETWSTRVHGNTYAEQPGATDITAAKSIAKQVEAYFSNVRVNWETVDEWTSFSVQWFAQSLPARKPSSATLHKNLLDGFPQIEALMLKAGAITKPFHIYVGSTGKAICINPDPKSIGKAWNIEISKVSDQNTAQETVTLHVGRHQVSLTTGDTQEILTEITNLANATDNYKDVYNIYYVLKAPNGFLKDTWSLTYTSEVEKARKLTKEDLKYPGIKNAINASNANVFLWKQGYPLEPENQTICGKN